MARPADYYKTLGRRQEGLAGRDQEGLPQARAPVPPGHEQGRRRRGALQADLRGLRRPRRPGEAQALRPRRRLFGGAPFGGGAAARRRRGRRRLRLLLGHPVRDLQHGRRAAARAHQARGRARARPRDDRLALVRAGGRGRAGAGLRRHARGLPRPAAAPAPAGHRAGRLPRLPGPRRRVPGPGPVLDHPPVRALRRLRHRDRGAVPHLRGQGRLRELKKYRVNIPAGVKDGSRIRLARQGRGRPARRPGGRPVRRHARRRVAGVPAQGRQPRGRGADHGRRGARGADVEVPTLHGTKKLRVPPGTKHGTVQRLRGEGPPLLGKGSSAATSTTAS